MINKEKNNMFVKHLKFSLISFILIHYLRAVSFEFSMCITLLIWAPSTISPHRRISTNISNVGDSFFFAFPLLSCYESNHFFVSIGLYVSNKRVIYPRAVKTDIMREVPWYISHNAFFTLQLFESTQKSHKFISSHMSLTKKPLYMLFMIVWFEFF